jgi:hypothetical protein
VEAVVSAPGQGLVPLYGIAIDLTPFDVVGTVAPAVDVPSTRSSSHAMPDVRPAGALRSGARTISSTRVTIVGQNGHQTFALVAVGIAALALMLIVPSPPPVRQNGASAAVVPVYAGPASVAGGADARALVAGKTGPKPKHRVTRPAADTAHSVPDNTVTETADPPAEPLATTLERLRGGIR